MNVDLEAQNFLSKTQKRVFPYCKIAFGNVVPTKELLWLSGEWQKMPPTFPKQLDEG